MSDDNIFAPKEDKPAVDHSPAPKRNKALIWVVGICLCAIAVLVFFLIQSRTRKEDRYTSEPMKQMAQTVQKIQGLETEIQDREKEVMTLVQDYKQKTGKSLPELNILNLTDEQKKLMEERIKAEKDLSTKSLLQDIINRNKELLEIKDKVNQLEALLPKSHVVEKSENHFQLAMDFLVNDKGIDKSKAMKLVERAALYEPLVPGFKVWNFYENGEYGTFVTQGTAAISPNSVQRKIKKDLVDARDSALSERDQVKADIQVLEARRNELIAQVELLNQEKLNMLINLEDLNKKNTEMQRTLNSLFYVVDRKKVLEEKGIIRGGFLRSLSIQKMPPEEFKKSIDLRNESKILFSAEQFGLNKIHKVVVYPKYYKPGNDFVLELLEDGVSAELTLLDPARFKSERLVVTVD
jgi:hypothetical protein